MGKLRELSVPPAVHSDPNATELVRAWAAHGGLHVSIDAAAWSDPGNWGIALVDLARHVADYYAKVGGRPREDVLARIKSVFEAEWEHPTDEPTGSLVQ
jgi:hypothetical protein